MAFKGDISQKQFKEAAKSVKNSKIQKEKSIGKHNLERYKSVKNKKVSLRQIECVREKQML